MQTGELVGEDEVVVVVVLVLVVVDETRVLVVVVPVREVEVEVVLVSVLDAVVVEDVLGGGVVPPVALNDPTYAL